MVDEFRLPDCPFAGVVVWSYSRFARDIDDSQFYRADLRRRGFDLYSITDPVPAGLDGRFFESAVDWMNQRFLDNLSKDVRRGMLYIIERHHAYPGGKAPTGYIKEAINIGKRRDGRDHVLYRLVPDPQTAPLVRRVFELRAGGATYREIHRATGLYNQITGYARLLRSRLYRGEYIWGDATVIDFCEPLIDEQTWQQAQSSPSLHPRRVRSAFLLSGIARCAVCGAILVGKTYTNGPHQRKNRYYRCHNKYDGLMNCKAPSIRKADLEAKVITALQAIVLDATIQQELYTEYMKQAEGWKAPLLARITGLDAQIASLEKRVSNLVHAIADGGHSSAMLMQLGDLERDLRDAQRLRHEAGRELERKQPPRYSIADIGEIVQVARDKLAGADDVAKIKVIRAFIARVDAALVDGELRVDVYYYGLPGTDATANVAL